LVVQIFDPLTFQPPSVRVAFAPGREQIRSAIRLGHADAEAGLASDDLRQHLGLDPFRCVFDQCGPGLAVGREVHGVRRVRCDHLLVDHEAVQKTALLPAISARPGHSNPSALSDLLREALVDFPVLLGEIRVECSSINLGLNERAHLGTKLLHVLGQA
jgi:hypothetical protein